MSDVKYRSALRAATGNPTLNNIRALANAAVRSGVFTPLPRAGRLVEVAAKAHLAALGVPGPLDDLRTARGGFRRQMAKAVVGGLALPDLEILLFGSGYAVPRCLWSPDGCGFGELLSPEDYSPSIESHNREGYEDTEVYIGYELPPSTRPYGRFSVTLLDGTAQVETNWDTNVSRLTSFVVEAYRGFTEEFISEVEDAEHIAAEHQMPVEDFYKAISSNACSLAQACFDIRHMHGPGWDDPLVFLHPNEVKRHFALEIAMDARKMLG